MILHPRNCSIKNLLNVFMTALILSECDIYADRSPYELLAVVGSVRINPGSNAVICGYGICDLRMDTEMVVEPI